MWPFSASEEAITPIAVFPLFVEVRTSGKTRAVFRLREADQFWHNYDVLFSDLSEAEWDAFLNREIPDVYEFVTETQIRGGWAFVKHPCKGVWLNVDQERKKIAIRHF